MSAKHTPGPWNTDLKFDGVIVTDEKGRLTAYCGLFGHGAPSQEERQANARLIAAAPDLLAALKAVEWGCEVDAEEGGFVPGCPSCGAEKRGGGHYGDCQLAAAIAKAEVAA